MTTSAYGIPRGPREQRLWSDLQNGYCVMSPASGLRGRAKQYRGRYQTSFTNFVGRARSAGYKVIIIPGPKGGVSSAHYSLVEAEHLCFYCKEQLPKMVLNQIMGEEKKS